MVPPLFDVDVLCDAVRRAGYGLGDAVACDRLGQALALAAWYEQWDREADGRAGVGPPGVEITPARVSGRAGRRG